MGKGPVIHPFLFSVAPVLFLYSHNIDQLSAGMIVWPLALALSLAAVTWLVAGLVVRDLRKSALASSLFLLLFFSYGHVEPFFRNAALWGRKPAGNVVVVTAWLLMLGLGAAALRKWQRGLARATGFFNVTAAAMILIPLCSSILWTARYRAAGPVAEAVDDVAANPVRRPDIYYIILDSYAREDVLRDEYGYDNSEFTRALEERGFYVAGGSRANYSQTDFSMASSMNMTLLEGLAKRMGRRSGNRRPLAEMVGKNAVMNFLGAQGYRNISLTSGWSCTETLRVDENPLPRGSLNEFENMLINMTPVSFIMDMVPERSQRAIHKERILYIFDELMSIPSRERDQPLFVFAHVLAPHPPFVFGRKKRAGGRSGPFSLDGDTLTERDEDKKNRLFRERYIRQLVYINGKLLEAVDRIISGSPKPPVIILQSDHGPRFASVTFEPNIERLAIFNAYYLPDGGRDILYEDVSPVNTFRIVFNRYFGTDYELLDDRSYFSEYESPYRLCDITEKLTGEAYGGPGK